LQRAEEQPSGQARLPREQERCAGDRHSKLLSTPNRTGSDIFATQSLLAKRESKCLNAKIEELDFEGSIYDWTFLPHELIESGLSNFAGASTRFRSRLWNRNAILPALHAAQCSPHDVPRPAQSPMI
jgi:hypothetical protein